MDASRSADVEDQVKWFNNLIDKIAQRLRSNGLTLSEDFKLQEQSAKTNTYGT